MNFERPFEQNQGDPSVDLANFNRIVRIVNTLAGLEFSQDFDVSQGLSGVLVSLADELGGGDSFPWEKCALGFKVNPDGDDPDEVRIYAGKIDKISVDKTDVTVADDDYVWVCRTVADDTMEVQAGSEVPADTDEYLYYRLYRFSVDDGTASISNIYRPFDIESGEGTGLPEGGEQYQVLQRDGTGAAVWDWVRFP